MNWPVASICTNASISIVRTRPSSLVRHSTDSPICLCKLARPEEARENIEKFQARYPHGAFQPYDTYIPALRGVGTVPVTQRERATLKRVESALTVKQRG